MRFFEKSKARDVQRLRTAGLSLAHANRLAQGRRSSGAILAIAAGAGAALIGAIAVVSLNLTTPQQSQQPAALLASQSVASQDAPLPQMAPLVTPPPPASLAIADDAPITPLPSVTGPTLLSQAVDAAIAEENIVRAQVAEETVQTAERAPDPSVEDVQPLSFSPDPLTVDCVARLDNLLSPLFVAFDLGSTDINAENAELLARISQRIIACDNAYIMVAGHADSSGDDITNMALSWERADQTLDRLVALGVDPQSVEAIGFGARAPLSQGSNEEESADRRVEFRVLRKREAF